MSLCSCLNRGVAELGFPPDQDRQCSVVLLLAVRLQIRYASSRSFFGMSTAVPKGKSTKWVDCVCPHDDNPVVGVAPPFGVMRWGLGWSPWAPSRTLLTILSLRDIAGVIIVIPDQRRRGDHTAALSMSSCVSRRAVSVTHHCSCPWALCGETDDRVWQSRPGL